MSCCFFCAKLLTSKFISHFKLEKSILVVFSLWLPLGLHFAKVERLCCMVFCVTVYKWTFSGVLKYVSTSLVDACSSDVEKFNKLSSVKVYMLIKLAIYNCSSNKFSFSAYIVTRTQQYSFVAKLILVVVCLCPNVGGSIRTGKQTEDCDKL